jgi:CRP-like cAMP-binding protein
MLRAAPAPPRNRLLLALGPAERDLLAPHLQEIVLRRGDVLTRPGETVLRAIFPHSALISMQIDMRAGGADSAPIGPEGFFGIEALLGATLSHGRAAVQLSGLAAEIELVRLARLAARNRKLREVLLDYAGGRLGQLAQSVACSALHTVEHRCCRWLVAAREAAGRDALEVTQDSLARTLGVRRASVNQAARRLQSLGIVRIRRGTVTVLDHIALESLACECTGTVRALFPDLGG